MATRLNDPSSAGHKLGQIVGDWWELHVIYPMLLRVAEELDLFLDNRCVTRACRTEKIVWKDAENNEVDYDFVLEMQGTPDKQGDPVAFFESFWRRGARHSKDKARDDTNKLLPMRETFPTARYLAITACGEFTAPAREYVQNRRVDLFFMPKSQIVRAFRDEGLEIDYADKSSEAEKARIAAALNEALDYDRKVQVAARLWEIVGSGVSEAFTASVIGKLSAQPQEIRFIRYHASEPACFSNISHATEFLADPQFSQSHAETSFGYEVTYSDGSEFSREVADVAALRSLHGSVVALVHHMHGRRHR